MRNAHANLSDNTRRRHQRPRQSYQCSVRCIDESDRTMKKRRIVALTVLGYMAWRCCYAPDPTILSLRIGQPFEEVVAASSFPVMTTSNLPSDHPHGFGATWVTEPAVIIQFNDPQYGFTAPATKFAAIAYDDSRVLSISTSPMLEKLPLNEAIAVIEFLQKQFQAGGWQLGEESSWIDVDMKNREALRASLHKNFEIIQLVAPKKYSAIINFYCAENCDSRLGVDLYLIDIGVCKDFGY
jgi:hypothetical protein